jgi:hypothetical protein
MYASVSNVLEFAVEWLAFLLRIREVPGSATVAEVFVAFLKPSRQQCSKWVGSENKEPLSSEHRW